MDKNAPVTKQDLAEAEARIEAKLEAKLDLVADRLTELIRDVETRLLTAFHGYGKGQAARMHVLNLETRRGPGSH